MKNNQLPKNKTKQDELIKTGENFAAAGNLEKALECYSQVLDCLVAGAKAHAEISENISMAAVFGKAMVSETYLQKFNEYLKKDQIASIVSNNMAVIFAKMGDKVSARAFFEQAIDLIPDGVVYDDPHIGLQTLGSI
jgi:tetratricopeptide (TPR) repeat protein